MSLLYTDYDMFAAIYNQHWGDFADRQALPVVEKYVVVNLPADAHILDLCCGTGQLARALSARGYRVTGIDGSDVMLRFARKNAPEATFRQADARDFTLEQPCHAALSTFDSLNHIMTLAELERVFRNVYSALLVGGMFLFDLNLEAGYNKRWSGSFGIVEEIYCCIMRSSYQPDERLGITDITMFHASGGNSWARNDLRLTQRCYSIDEVLGALHRAGFRDAAAYDIASGKRADDATDRGLFIGKK